MSEDFWLCATLNAQLELVVGKRAEAQEALQECATA
jgi:hypothetical protein